MRPAILATFGVMALSPASALAARDPDWPCQQIKVAELSLAAVWSGPDINTGDSSWKDDPVVAGLVQRLAPRREPIDQAQSLIHDFARHAGDQKSARLLQVLVGLFSVLSAERDSVMTGLDRFGGRQKQLAAEIRADNEKLRALQDDPASDPKAIEQMTQQVKWEVEIFQDRRQALSYACEVPGKIEQRVFLLARYIRLELD